MSSDGSLVLRAEKRRLSSSRRAAAAKGFSSTIAGTASSTYRHYAPHLMTTSSAVSHRSTTTRRTPLEHHWAATEVPRNSGHPPGTAVPGQFRARGLTGLRPAGGDTVTVYRPLSPSQANKGSRNIAPSGDSAPLHPPRRGRASSEIRCPRELDILLL